MRGTCGHRSPPTGGLDAERRVGSAGSDGIDELVRRERGFEDDLGAGRELKDIESGGIDPGQAGDVAVVEAVGASRDKPKRSATPLKVLPSSVS